MEASGSSDQKSEAEEKNEIINGIEIYIYRPNV
jgi:hypothetical protein